MRQSSVLATSRRRGLFALQDQEWHLCAFHDKINLSLELVRQKKKYGVIMIMIIQRTQPEPGKGGA
ncbi:hypothetical protein PAECIP111890_04143 [Paenibacillus sp. JJ-223]|nr:hypothetical protein PAECIP111890_04143 [Paenibacillus sp. JJ-223]